MAETRPKLLISVIESVIAALGGKDKDTFVKQFGDNVVMRDPYGGSEYKGKDGIKQYWDNLFNIWFYYDIRLTSYYMGGDNRIAVRWSVSGTALNNKTADFTGIAIYDFNEDRQIISIESYWNYERVLEQIKNE